MLQRRQYGTFKLYRVDEKERPDLVERFGVGTMPTLVVVEDKVVRARLERPRGCREIETFLCSLAQVESQTRACSRSAGIYLSTTEGPADADC